MLDHLQRQNNLKLRGVPEDVGGNLDLPDLISDWLSSELKLGPNSSVVITRAFRVGAKINPWREGPETSSSLC